jgi:hypothetical protein
MRTLAALVLAIAASFAVATPAHANRERIAIAIFQVTGEPMAEEAQQKLRTSLRGGLNAAGFDVVADDEVQRAITVAGVAGCDTVACLRRVGEVVMVRRVVKATIEVLGPTHVSSTLELVDLGEGKTIANANDDCSACNSKEVRDGLSNAAAALRMQLEPPTVPPLPPAPTAAPAETPSHRNLYIGLAAGSGALFVASVVTLAVTAGFHGKSNCGSDLPPDERCPTRYNGTPGIVLGAIGTPLFGVATAILAYKAWKSPRRAVALLPSVGPGGASVDLRLDW